MTAKDAYEEFVADVITPACERIRRLGGYCEGRGYKAPAVEYFLGLKDSIAARENTTDALGAAEACCADRAELTRLEGPFARLADEIGLVFYHRTESVRGVKDADFTKGHARHLIADTRICAERYHELILTLRRSGFTGDPAAARAHEERLRNALRECVALLRASLERAEDAYRRLEPGGDPPAAAGPSAEP